MNACVGLGYVEEAERVLGAMLGSGMRPDVRAYNVLLKGHARAGNAAGLQAQPTPDPEFNIPLASWDPALLVSLSAPCLPCQ